MEYSSSKTPTSKDTTSASTEIIEIALSDDDDDCVVTKSVKGGDKQPGGDKRPGGDNCPDGNKRPGGDNRPGGDRRSAGKDGAVKAAVDTAQTSAKKHKCCSKPGCGSKVTVKRTIVSYLLLDSESDYSDVEICEEPPKTVPVKSASREISSKTEEKDIGDSPAITPISAKKPVNFETVFEMEVDDCEISNDEYGAMGEDTVESEEELEMQFDPSEDKWIAKPKELDKPSSQSDLASNIGLPVDTTLPTVSESAAPKSVQDLSVNTEKQLDNASDTIQVKSHGENTDIPKIIFQSDERQLKRKSDDQLQNPGQTSPMTDNKIRKDAEAVVTLGSIVGEPSGQNRNIDNPVLSAALRRMPTVASKPLSFTKPSIAVSLATPSLGPVYSTLPVAQQSLVASSATPRSGAVYNKPSAALQNVPISSATPTPGAAYHKPSAALQNVPISSATPISGPDFSPPRAIQPRGAVSSAAPVSRYVCSPAPVAQSSKAGSPATPVSGPVFLAGPGNGTETLGKKNPIVCNAPSPALRNIATSAAPAAQQGVVGSSANPVMSSVLLARPGNGTESTKFPLILIPVYGQGQASSSMGAASVFQGQPGLSKPTPPSAQPGTALTCVSGSLIYKIVLPADQAETPVGATNASQSLTEVKPSEVEETAGVEETAEVEETASQLRITNVFSLKDSVPLQISNTGTASDAVTEVGAVAGGQDDCAAEPMGSDSENTADDSTLFTADVSPSQEFKTETEETGSFDGFPVSYQTLGISLFREHLRQPQPSEKLLHFLEKAQDKRISVCHSCGERVFVKTCLVMNGVQLPTANIMGLLFVTLQELVRLTLIDDKIGQHYLLCKKEFPAVWSAAVCRSKGQIYQGISLVYLFLVMEFLSENSEQFPENTRLRLTNANAAILNVIGFEHFQKCHRQPTSPASDVKYQCSEVLKRLVLDKREMTMKLFVAEGCSTSAAPALPPVLDTSPVPLDTNPGMGLGKYELQFASIWMTILTQGVYGSDAFALSSRFMYPACGCMELSKLDLAERQLWMTIDGSSSKIDHLGVVRFMNRNIFCFYSKGLLHMSLCEIQQRGLLPPDYRNILPDSFLPRLYQQSDARKLTLLESKFLAQFFTVNSMEALTPYGLQQLYCQLKKEDFTYDRHSKAIYYMMILGHHCCWSLQVTPPTCQLHKVPGYERPGGEEQPAAIIHNTIFDLHLDPKAAEEYKNQKLKKAFYDGGGGTPPACKQLNESLLDALKKTISKFGLEHVAEPYCQCDINTTKLHTFKFLTFQDVEMSHVTEMIFCGKLLHCWRRHFGLYVNMLELKLHDFPLGPESLSMEELTLQPAISYILENEQVFVHCLPRFSHSETEMRLARKLINIRLLPRMFENAVGAEHLRGQKFRVKLWKHLCPTEQETLVTGTRESSGLCSVAVVGNVAAAAALPVPEKRNMPFLTSALNQPLNQQRNLNSVQIQKTGPPQLVPGPPDLMLSHQRLMQPLPSLQVASTSSPQQQQQQPPTLLQVQPQFSHPLLFPAQQLPPSALLQLQGQVPSLLQQRYPPPPPLHPQPLPPQYHLPPPPPYQPPFQAAVPHSSTSAQFNQVPDLRQHDGLGHTGVQGGGQAQQAQEDCSSDEVRIKDEDPQKYIGSEACSLPSTDFSSQPAVLQQNWQTSRVVSEFPGYVSSRNAASTSHIINQSDASKLPKPKLVHRRTASKSLTEHLTFLKKKYGPYNIVIEKACKCAERMPAIFPSYSFKQCTLDEKGQFTIVESIGEAVVKKRIVNAFYAKNEIFFSVVQLQRLGLLPKSDELTTMNLYKGNNFRLLDEEVKIVGEENVMEKVACSAVQLRQALCLDNNIAMGSKKESSLVLSIALHQMGHICPDRESLVFKVQQLPEMSYVQHAWMAAYNWQLEFGLHIALAQKKSLDVRKCHSTVALCIRELPTEVKSGSSEKYEFVSLAPTEWQTFTNPNLELDNRRAPPSSHFCLSLNLKMGNLLSMKLQEGDSRIDKCSARMTQTLLASESIKEGIVLDMKEMTIDTILSDDYIKSLLNESLLQTHSLVLTGVLTAADTPYCCLFLDGRLYVNWADVVSQLSCYEDQAVCFKNAQHLHAFLYQVPEAVHVMLAERYGMILDQMNSAPWVCVNTLVAVYNMGSGMLERERMLKRFVDIGHSNVTFYEFLLVRKSRRLS